MKKMALGWMIILLSAAACSKNGGGSDEEARITDMSLDKTSLNLYTTDRERLTPITSPSGSFSVRWTTSDKEVAVVDEKGAVKATGAGTAVITATIGGKSATCQVSVSPAVFVAGYNSWDNEIFLWKNGKRWILNENQYASIEDMVIYEGDVYLVGSRASSIYGAKAILLKLSATIPGEQPHANDEEQYVMESTSKYSSGYGVFVANGDMYVCGEDNFLREGYTNVYYRCAALWKNGKVQHLTNNTSGDSYYRARSVFVSGKDVYVVGQKDKRAALWKNGVHQELVCEGTTFVSTYDLSSAAAVFVSGSDVYVAGVGSFPSSVPSLDMPSHKAILWKNGVAQILEGPSSYANSVYVSGSDVYVAGSAGTLWKNGVVQPVIDNARSFYSVFVYGDDVYTAGIDGKGHHLWKNGELQELEGMGNWVHSVIVK